MRVTSPRTEAPRTRRVSARSEIDARTPLGEVYVSSLLRAQLRLGLGLLVLVVAGIAGLPLLFRFAPESRAVQVLGMPLPWVLLAFAVYPAMFAVGWLYVRRAERNERRFASVLERESIGEERP